MAVYFEMQNLTTGVALDEAAFPDAAFRTLLAKTADVNGDSRLSALELRHVSELNCSNLGIADLTGIEHFTELVALNCENNQLTALDVSKNTHLSEIYCGGNQLATLDLTGLPIKDAETDTGHVQKLPGSYALTGTENGVGLFDLSQIVGKDNIGNITAVKGGSVRQEDRHRTLQRRRRKAELHLRHRQQCRVAHGRVHARHEQAAQIPVHGCDGRRVVL